MSMKKTIFEDIPAAHSGERFWSREGFVVGFVIGLALGLAFGVIIHREYVERQNAAFAAAVVKSIFGD
mgnify:CR=1 FL=1